MRHLTAENKGSLRIIRPAKRRPLFARLIGSVTYAAIVVYAAVFTVVECCFANQINKGRRRKREKTNGGAIIGDETAISIDSPPFTL